MIRRRVTMFAALVTLASFPLLGGCLVVVNDRVETDDSLHYTTHEPGAYDGAIRAAAGLSFSTDRNRTLAVIAAKPDLAESDQLSIVRVLVAKGGFGSDILPVLESLIKNPATTARTQSAISSRLEKLLTFSSDRQKIAMLMIDHPPKPCAKPAATGCAEPCPAPTPAKP